MSFPGYGQAPKTRAQTRLRIGAIVVTSLVVLAGGAYLMKPRGEIPKDTQMPEGWFQREAFQPPDAWTLPGAGRVRVATGAPLRIELIAEPRADVAVEFARAGDAAGVAVVQGAETLISTPRSEGAACTPPTASAPLLRIRTPQTVSVETVGPVSGEVDGAQRLMLRDSGCGRWRIVGDAAQLWLAKAGPGRIEAQSAVEAARAHIDGDGRIDLRQVRGALDAVIRGDGAISLAEGGAAIDLQIWGTGRFDRAAGFAGTARYFMKGRGEVLDQGGVGGLFAEAFNGGHIKVARVRGGVTGFGRVDYNNLHLNVE